MRRTMLTVLAGLLFSVAMVGTATAEPAGEDAVSERARDLAVEKLDSGDESKLQRRQVVVANSARAMSEAIGHKVPDSGDGTYLAACWGEKQTAGYSIKVASASKAGDKVSVQMRLNRPDGATLQVFTHPYTVVFIKDLKTPKGKSFSFYAQDGDRLDWPLRRV